MNRSSYRLLCLVVLVVAEGCATAPAKRAELEPEALARIVQQMCSVGGGTRWTKGTAWLKASQGDKSFQLPAVLEARAPDALKLEVHNPFGGMGGFPSGSSRPVPNQNSPRSRWKRPSGTRFVERDSSAVCHGAFAWKNPLP